MPGGVVTSREDITARSLRQNRRTRRESFVDERCRVGERFSEPAQREGLDRGQPVVDPLPQVREKRRTRGEPRHDETDTGEDENDENEPNPKAHASSSARNT